MTDDVFGTFEGEPVHAVTLSNGGLRARLIAFGARPTELRVPDRDGGLADIVLGYDSPAEYVAGDTYFGATCGRHANRIARGRFTLGGEAFQLDCDEGANHLHGGGAGFVAMVKADRAADRVRPAPGRPTA